MIQAGNQAGGGSLRAASCDRRIEKSGRTARPPAWPPPPQHWGRQSARRWGSRSKASEPRNAVPGRYM